MSSIEKGSRLYVAGPMTYMPQFNFPAFDAAAERLEARGYPPILPADMNEAEVRKAAMASPDGAPGSGAPDGRTWGDFLKEDVKLVADLVDGVAVLEGWERSRGARLETFCAALCDKPVVYEDTLEPVHELSLVAAWATVVGIDLALAEIEVANA